MYRIHIYIPVKSSKRRKKTNETKTKLSEPFIQSLSEDNFKAAETL